MTVRCENISTEQQKKQWKLLKKKKINRGHGTDTRRKIKMEEENFQKNNSNTFGLANHK